MWRIRRKQSRLRRRALQSLDVLVIDETDVTAELTLLGIRRAAPSAKVIRFRDPGKALHFVALAESGPTLVLLELGSSLHGGLQTLEQLRGHPRTSTIPIIILTAMRDPSAAQESFALGASAFVEKSNTPDEYCAQVERVLEQWLAKNGKISNR